MNSNTIRQAFLDFFERKGHRIVSASSLVPETDSTLLFTNAGMVQFKDIFTGQATPEFSCAASAQPCVRAGGKHNDLDNVGYTSRHHTLFEMLGNFSFGEYFKREAIGYAWEFVTQVLAIDPQRLWVTVHESDDEAAGYWLKDIGLKPERLIRLGDESNFWAMGPTGPCGPCSEIFYDHGERVTGGPPGSADEDGDRYVEIWNLVFMQYERKPDGSRVALPKPCVDTGMGLERVTAVMQGVYDNYDTDLFVPLTLQLGTTCRATTAHPRTNGGLVRGEPSEEQHLSMRVVADHIRSIAFLIADSVYPDREGRGYVLRRIIRRALRHCRKLSDAGALMAEMLPVLIDSLGEAYPRLRTAEKVIRQTLAREEELFGNTLEQGLKRLSGFLEQKSDESATLPGQLVFELYDTFGFPPDLTADIAREQGLNLAMDEFEQAMQAQKDRARSASRFAGKDNEHPNVDISTQFTGYSQSQDTACVQKLYQKAGGLLCEVSELKAGEGMVVLDKTPFYAEAGGQIGDSGWLTWEQGRFRVERTNARNQSCIHYGRIEQGCLRTETRVSAAIDNERRQRIRANHSATHLLHAALRKLLGERVEQKGSLVGDQHLRFDFSHDAPLTRAQCRELEDMVNAEIRRDSPVVTEIMGFDEARARGALALFGEKYARQVRVLTMGEGFSMELCGGTHVRQTGDIDLFRITSESGIAANVRRIEAVTGEAARAWTQQQDSAVHELQSLLQAKPEHLLDKARSLRQQNKALQKSLDKQGKRLAVQLASTLAEQADQFGEAHSLVTQVGVSNKKVLMGILDDLKSRLNPAVLVLAGGDGEKVSLVANVNKRLTSRVKANELVQQAGELMGTRGGGKANMAEAGGGDASRLPQTLDRIRARVESALKKIA